MTLNNIGRGREEASASSTADFIGHVEAAGGKAPGDALHLEAILLLSSPFGRQVFHRDLTGYTSYLPGRRVEISPQMEPRFADLAHAGSDRTAQFSQETFRQIEKMNRFDNAGSGVMSNHELNRCFAWRSRQATTERSSSQPPRELKALTDAIAAMFNPDRRHPYDTVRTGAYGDYAVGRYGLTANLVYCWLSSMDEFTAIMGSPPDWSHVRDLMSVLAQKGKISQTFASKFENAEFAAQFPRFLCRLDNGEGRIAPKDIRRFLPADLQERIAGDLASRFLIQSSGHPEQVVLAIALGKPLTYLTELEVDDSENERFMQAALRMYALALARQQSQRKDRIEWKNPGAGAPLSLRIARAAEQNAERTNTSGWCYRGVAETLAKFGISLYGRSAYMAADQLAASARVQEVSTSDLRPGDILVHGKSAGHKHGHIAIYLGHGREASDHVQRLISGRGYGGTRVFRVKG